MAITPALTAYFVLLASFSCVYCQIQCVYDGKSYPPGSYGIRATDGCNSCNCLKDGTVACTEMACPTDGGCLYNGKYYDNGEGGIPYLDGCNTCFCSSGDLGCTLIGCIDMRPCLKMDGTAVLHGSPIDGEEGCTGCKCENGHVECDSCPGDCMYDGKSYRDGETGIPATDGCNTCFCDKGQVGCTEIGCPEPCSEPGEMGCLPGSAPHQQAMFSLILICFLAFFYLRG